MELEMGLSLRGADNVAAILPRISLAVEERAKKDNTTIDLGTAENWLIRDELINLCREAIPEGLVAKHLSYPDGFGGDSQLLEALSGFFNRHFAPVVPVLPSHIATAPGAAASLDALLYNICEAGDGVLVPGPFWNGFDWLFKVRSGVHPVVVNVDSLDRTFTSDLITALTSTMEGCSRPIKALVLTNPHNPLGKCYPRSIIEECIKFCQEHNIHLISDEVYAMSGFPSEDLVDPVPFFSVLSVDMKAIGCDSSRVHVVWSTSKDFCCSGFRMGCCVTQSNRAMQVGAALAANTQVSSLTAIATAALLNSPKLQSLIDLSARRLSESCKRVTSFLQENGIEYSAVSHGPFIFARIMREAQTWEEEDEAIACLKEAGVMLSPGRAYHVCEGDKGWARITFAVKPEVLESALQRLEAGLKKMKLRLKVDVK